MPAMQLRRHEVILERMISLAVSRTDLSDLTDTSVFKHILAACARELDECYYQLTRLRDTFDLSKAKGEDLDARAKEIQPATLTRLQSRSAVTSVVFSRVGTSGTVIIPTGTIVKTGDGKLFKTTLQGSILDTQNDSESISVIASIPGAAGNVASGTIVKFGAKISGVDSVTNPAGASQGRDQETDGEFRQRIRNFIASLARCTPQAYEFAAVGSQDVDSGKQVVFAHVYEDPILLGKVTLYIDDGAGTAMDLGTAIVDEEVSPTGGALGGEEFLNLDFFPIDIDGSTFVIESSDRGVLVLGTDVFVNPTTGLLFFSPPLSVGEVIEVDYTPFEGLIPVVTKIIEGDKDDRLNFPGFRAAGTLVRVLAPNTVSVDVEASLTLEDGIDRATAVAEAEEAVLDYINNQGISGNIIRNELIQRIMDVTGVTDVDLVLPTGNVNILDNQIARSTTSDINIT